MERVVEPSFSLRSMNSAGPSSDRVWALGVEVEVEVHEPVGVMVSLRRGRFVARESRSEGGWEGLVAERRRRVALAEE